MKAAYGRRIVEMLCLLCGGQGGRISLRSIFSQKQPRVVVRGLTAFPRSWGGRSPITNETVSPTCHSDLVKYDRGIMAGNMWAVAMMDSDGELPAGVLSGAYHWVGDYKQCLSVKGSGVNVTDLQSGELEFDGEYCRAYFKVDKNVFSLGVCVPSSCREHDVSTLLSTGNGSLPVFHTECSKEMRFWKDWRAITATCILIFFGVLIAFATFVDTLKSRIASSLPPTGAKCGNETETVVSDAAAVHAGCELTAMKGDGVTVEPKVNGDVNSDPKVNGGVISDPNVNRNVKPHASLEMMTLTVEESVTPRPACQCCQGTTWQVLRAFSLCRNVPRIISARHAPGSYTCLHGVRVILAAWIVLGHTFDIGLNLPFGSTLAVGAEVNISFTNLPVNQLGQHKLRKDFAGQVLETYTLAVDGFFLISAALVTISFSKHLSRQGGMPKLLQMVRYYVHRYLRLTPPYAILIMLAACYFHYVSYGPLAADVDGSDKCKRSWWSLLLYIDIFVDEMRQCVGWTWYLTLDFQFYAIAPLFIWLLYRFPIFGGIFLFAGYTGSLTARVVILSRKLPYLEYMLRVYMKPWTRFGPYAIGIALGMIMYRTKCRVRMPKVLVVLGWLVGSVLCLVAVYGNYQFDNKSLVEYRAYMSTLADVFTLGMAWLVFACCTGYGGFVNRFLSWNFFIPLSRLTYTLYLIHPLIIYAYTYGRMQLIYVQYSTVVILFCAYWLLGNMAAFAMSLAFELPFIDLEKIIFSGQRT
ncbi:O-acyltransferase like protein [Lamellibrachia satsuma]|nr:O-acyltransferase like protein [Lamellibrachia satsuma]